MRRDKKITIKSQKGNEEDNARKSTALQRTSRNAEREEAGLSQKSPPSRSDETDATFFKEMKNVGRA